MESQIRYTNNGRYFLSHTIRRNYRKEGIIDYDNSKEKEIKVNENSIKNLNKGYENKGISLVTQKKIKIRCRVLSYASKIKEVKNHQGNFIQHKTSFVTLTLPSKQIHTDQQITKLILAEFLGRCRKVGLLNNYVWKAEKQKNGNIHYHLLTDSYITKTIVYRYWLLCLNKLGYVDNYTNKFNNMSLADYKKIDFNKNLSDLTINGRFWKGNKNRWKLPPCFDTINVTNDNSIEKYLAKYMSKNENDSGLKVDGRVWGCSNNINEAVDVFKNDNDFNQYGFNMAKYVMKSKVFIGDFFEVVLMKMSSFFAWFPKEALYIIEKLRVFIKPCAFHLQV